MADSILSYKVVEGISNIMKKTVLFEKTERIKTIFIGLTLCSSVVLLYNTYTNIQIENIMDKLIKLVEKITNSKI